MNRSLGPYKLAECLPVLFVIPLQQLQALLPQASSVAQSTGSTNASAQKGSWPLMHTA